MKTKTMLVILFFVTLVLMGLGIGYGAARMHEPAIVVGTIFFGAAALTFIAIANSELDR